MKTLSWTEMQGIRWEGEEDHALQQIEDQLERDGQPHDIEKEHFHMAEKQCEEGKKEKKIEYVEEWDG